MREVYITRVSSFLPNRVVENDNMEQYLGLSAISLQGHVPLY